jgi:hypothetical protein
MGSMTAGEITMGGARGVMRLSRGSIVSIVLAVAAAAALGVGIASLGPSVPEASEFISQLSPEEESEGKGGYRFAHPDEWELQTDGAVSKVSNPAGSMVVSVGPGLEGNLRQTSTAFVDSVERQYRGVEVSSSDSTSVEGNPAFLTSGTAINDRGAELRLYAIAIEEAGRHFMVAGYSDAGEVEAQTLSARVTEIAHTLEAAG